MAERLGARRRRLRDQQQGDCTNARVTEILHEPTKRGLREMLADAVRNTISLQPDHADEADDGG